MPGVYADGNINKPGVPDSAAGEINDSRDAWRRA